MMVLRARLIVFGSVQGVNYRWFVQEAAKGLGVNGWVKNLEDDSVEIECEAESEKAYRDFLTKIEKKATGQESAKSINVDKIQVVAFEKDVEAKHNYFNIEY